MSRFDAYAAQDAYARNDAYDAYDAYRHGGGPGAPISMLAEALTRSREAHLGRAQVAVLPPGVVAQTPPQRIKLAKIRQWGSVDGTLPPASIKLLARIGPGTRAQLYANDLMSFLRFVPATDALELKHAPLSGSPHPIFKLQRPQESTFKAQAERVESWAALHSERLPEILTQLGPQFEYWSSILNLNPAYSPYTIELLATAVAFASNVVQQFKYLLPVPRPVDYSPRIQPLIEAPAFFAFPSGHGTQAFTIARILGTLLRQSVKTGNLLNETVPVLHELDVQLYRQAERIATNRVVAGVHYPIDNTAGCALGLTLGEYFAHRCAGTEWRPRQFVLDQATELRLEKADFEPVIEKPTTQGKLLSVKAFDGHRTGDAQGLASAPGTPFNAGCYLTSGLSPSTPTSPLVWLWHMAAREWHDAGYV